MFVQPKNKTIKSVKKLFAKKPWLTLLIAAIIFVSFTTAVVYEQYVMNQDNLAKYLPADTALYIHANTLKSSFVYKTFADFIKTHPRFADIWLNSRESKFFSIWPGLNGIDHQEIAYALIPRNEKYQPVLLLFLESEQEVAETIAQWQSAAWFVFRNDNVLIVSREPFYQWNTGNLNLAKVFAQEKIPLANQFYAYADLANYQAWLPSTGPGLYLAKLFEYWPDDKFQLFAFIRENTLLLTGRPDLLGHNPIKSSANWLDHLDIANSLSVKNADLRQIADFLLANEVIFRNFNLDLRDKMTQVSLRYDYDILNDFILKLKGQTNVFISNIEGTDALSLGNKNIVLDVKLASDFDLAAWEKFLKTAASFKFPVEETRQLPDGTDYKLLTAKVSGQVEIAKTEIQPGQIINSVRSGSQSWSWYYFYNQERLIVSNNKALLTSIVSGQIYQSAKNQSCYDQTVEYLKFNVPFEISSELGLKTVLLNIDNGDLVMCAQ